jgi:hypothetical protein
VKPDRGQNFGMRSAATLFAPPVGRDIQRDPEYVRLRLLNCTDRLASVQAQEGFVQHIVGKLPRPEGAGQPRLDSS